MDALEMKPAGRGSIQERHDRLRRAVDHVAHLLPAQGPIGVFVHPARQAPGFRSFDSSPKLLYNRYFPETFTQDYNAQKNFPTEQPQARQNARVSDTYEDRRRPGRHSPAPRHRPQEADGQLRAVTRSRRRNQQAFPKVSGCCDQAISEGFTIREHATRVHSSRLSACLYQSCRSQSSRHRSPRKRLAPVSDLPRPKHSAKPLCATESGAGCVKPSGSSWHH